jgi:hypothetical protein
MEIITHKSTATFGTDRVEVVPSHPDGSFVIDHGPYGSPEVYDAISLVVSPEAAALACQGDVTEVRQLIEADDERAGFYKIAGFAGMVMRPVSASYAPVPARVGEFQEVLPN